MLKRLIKDENAFYMVEYVILTSLVTVFLVGTIEFTVTGGDPTMGTAMKGADSAVGIKASEMKTVSGALSPLYKFIVNVLGIPIG